MDSNELYHHGIKGMKWGVRRYQNKDGSLTNAGRKREAKQLAKNWKNGSPPNTVKVKAKYDKKTGTYRVTEYRKVKNNPTRGWSKDAKAAYTMKKKGVKGMSNAELKKVNERRRLENEYRNLNPNKVKSGLKYVTAVAGGMGTVIALYNNSNTLIGIGKKATKRFMK